MFRFKDDEVSFNKLMEEFNIYVRRIKSGDVGLLESARFQRLTDILLSSEKTTQEGKENLRCLKYFAS